MKFGLREMDFHGDEIYIKSEGETVTLIYHQQTSAMEYKTTKIVGSTQGEVLRVLAILKGKPYKG